MKPTEAIATLTPMVGQILQDLDWPFQTPTDLAPFTGRLVEGLVYEPHQDRLRLNLEPPGSVLPLHDEPASLGLPCRRISQIHRSGPRGGCPTIYVEIVLSIGTVTISTLPASGRTCYETPTTMERWQAATVHVAYKLDERRLTNEDLYQAAKGRLSRRKIADLARSWIRAGWLETPGKHGIRFVTEAALQVALTTLGGWEVSQSCHK